MRGGACARGDDQRDQPANEGEGGHHHGAKAQRRRLGGGAHDVSPGVTLLHRELDDQDGVLRGQRDQHDNADLGVDVVVEAEELQSRHRPEQADDDRQQGGNRYRPALVEADEKEVGEDDREPEDGAGLSRRRLLLQRRSCPFIGKPVRQGGRGDGLHRRDRLARRVAGSRPAIDRDRAQIIVANDR